MLLTIVRSLVGREVDLPGKIKIRPWHFVELKGMTSTQRALIEKLVQDRVVTVSQLRDGRPLDKLELEAKNDKGD